MLRGAGANWSLSIAELACGRRDVARVHHGDNLVLATWDEPKKTPGSMHSELTIGVSWGVAMPKRIVLLVALLQLLVALPGCADTDSPMPTATSLLGVGPTSFLAASPGSPWVSCYPDGEGPFRVSMTDPVMDASGATSKPIAVVATSALRPGRESTYDIHLLDLDDPQARPSEVAQFTALADSAVMVRVNSSGNRICIIEVRQDGRLHLEVWDAEGDLQWEADPQLHGPVSYLSLEPDFQRTLIQASLSSGETTTALEPSCLVLLDESGRTESTEVVPNLAIAELWPQQESVLICREETGGGVLIQRKALSSTQQPDFTTVWDGTPSAVVTASDRVLISGWSAKTEESASGAAPVQMILSKHILLDASGTNQWHSDHAAAAPWTAIVSPDGDAVCEWQSEDAQREQSTYVISLTSDGKRTAVEGTVFAFSNNGAVLAALQADGDLELTPVR